MVGEAEEASASCWSECGWFGVPAGAVKVEEVEAEAEAEGRTAEREGETAGA